MEADTRLYVRFYKFVVGRVDVLPEEVVAVESNGGSGSVIYLRGGARFEINRVHQLVLQDLARGRPDA